MATKKASTPITRSPLLLLVSREEAKARLQDRIEKGRAIRQQAAGSVDGYEELKNLHNKWDAFNEQLLKTIFTTDELAQEYSQSGSIGILSIGGFGPTLGEQIATVYKELEKEIHRIDSIIERLELIPLADASSAIAAAPLDATPQPRSKKVFVVHGRDEVAKTNLEVFLRENGLEPVVLHRQADEGLTIIEKFEKHSDVGYAFILLTPDEIAYLASDETKPETERKKEFRARPNVIFEFGYFVGKLGRPRVCCLYTGKVTIPSDLSGLVYKQYQNNIEEMGYSMLKDLRASGYSV